MTLAKLTPQQAADKASVSRGTIMNAIKDKTLIALRDNRNRWQINPDNLSKWMAYRSDNISDKPDNYDSKLVPQSDENVIRIAVLEAEANAKDQRILDLESDRDSWREQAQQLAQNKTRRWWPF
jgi:excisionase family DNA binding protein